MIKWFNSFLGEAVGTYAAIGVGLLIVVILIIILLRILRSFTGGMFGNKSQNRLGVIEAAAVDNKRRLVLVRRDNVEHLIMIGGTSDILIEAGVNRAAPTPRPNQPPAPKKPAAQAPTQQAPTQNAAPQASTPPAPSPAASSPTVQSPQATAQAVSSPTAPSPQATAPKPAAPASAPTQATAPAQTAPPVAAPARDSAKVGDDMDRLLNQLAGDAKG